MSGLMTWQCRNISRPRCPLSGRMDNRKSCNRLSAPRCGEWVDADVERTTGHLNHACSPKKRARFAPQLSRARLGRQSVHCAAGAGSVELIPIHFVDRI
jgi:hypothetical protein